MMHCNFASLSLFCVTTFVLPMTAAAVPITVPPGLNPGDHYRLVFVTSTTRDALSSNIDDYNTFVNGVANTPPSPIAGFTTWTAIASTATFAARDNTATHPGVSPDAPIYDLAGNLIANNNADLWDGSLATAIRRTEAVVIVNGATVWTGSAIDGTPSQIAGGTLGGGTPVVGIDSNGNGGWLLFDLPAGSTRSALYAMSAPLTVVPEPGSIVLAGLAAVGLAVASVRRRRLRSS